MNKNTKNVLFRKTNHEYDIRLYYTLCDIFSRIFLDTFDRPMTHAKGVFANVIFQISQILRKIGKI